ncbi:hypothetical protein MSG28_004183 [Choristoneura fumiferana]|uniref:Uncharacterized protein n=1 Tax=Choristoneura fumiferana TaxID=7141 RepID=A0ACC0KIN4_CHOFU|nr:hypothetical protein MSG28_004183 [Choristoneura fumiferana]
MALKSVSPDGKQSPPPRPANTRGGKRACGSPDGKQSPPPMETCQHEGYHRVMQHPSAPHCQRIKPVREFPVAGKSSSPTLDEVKWKKLMLGCSRPGMGTMCHI